MTTYKAAIWRSDDGQGSVVLTLPEESGKNDEELLRLAHEEAEKERLDLDGGEIVIGDWTD